MTIYFYQVDRPYGCFSNFSPHPIEMGSEHWPTVEHYYQSRKFLGTEWAKLIPEIAAAPTPELAAAIGRHPHHRPRPDWEQHKLFIMTEAVERKFLTYPELQTVLLATGQQEIVEDSPVDYFWGCGLDRSGSNHLGQILMQLRAHLRLNSL